MATIRDRCLGRPRSWLRVAALASVIAAVLGLVGCSEPAPEEASAESQWSEYRQRFITPEGRTVDTGNAGVTHSEAQGFAMLLAVGHDDRQVFDRLWSWTETNLRVRGDRLFAWRWEPGAGVTDSNNATDGDLLVAWALLRAGERWQAPSYRDEALAIAGELRTRLVRESAHGLVLLPGEHGFVDEEKLTVNLSYWIFPALLAFERADPAPEWRQLIDSGLGLLRSARFGRWQLPPDWLQVEPRLEVSTDFPPVFGYNAVRIPLYLCWAGLAEPELLDPFLSYWDHFGGARFVSPWTNLNDDSVDSHDAIAGIHAVILLTRDTVDGEDAGSEHSESNHSQSKHSLSKHSLSKHSLSKHSAEVLARSPIEDQAYYSASLTLLSRLAAEERP